jgi:acyl dehydratase
MMIQALHETGKKWRLADLHEGQSWQESRTITREMLDAFVDVSLDSAPVHTSAEHAVALGYKGCVVHGMLANLAFSRLLGMFLPGTNSVIHHVHLDMLAPVYVGDTLTYEVRIERLVPSVNSVRLSLAAVNQDGTTVTRGQAACVMRG